MVDHNSHGLYISMINDFTMSIESIPSGRSLRVRDEFDAQPFQLACEDPIPAGTALHMRSMWQTQCHEVP